MLPNTYRNNKTSLIEKGDYGIKIAVPGVDINSARDSDLIFSSAWPALQLTQVISSPPTSFFVGTQAEEHGLDFPPLVLSFPTASSGNSALQVAADSKYYYRGYNFDTFYVFNIDLSKDIEYPYDNKTTVSRPYDTDYGIKIPKTGYSVDDTDLNNFILHSRCQSLLVLSVKTESTYNTENDALKGSNAGVVQYSHTLGYPTLNYGYVKYPKQTNGVGDYYEVAPTESTVYPVLLRTNGVTSYVEYGTGGSTGATIVSLRNPFFAPTINEVIY